MKYMAFAAIGFVVLGMIFSEVGSCLEERERQAEPVAAYDYFPTQQEKPDAVIACDYLVKTFQLRFDSIRIANFEPKVTKDYFSPPADTITLYGKEINRNLWEGSFALQVKPYTDDARVLSLNWERLGRCYVKRLEPKEDDVPSR